MNNLKKRFDEAIKDACFTTLEVKEFQEKPKLGIKVGMAIGYRLAIEDLASQHTVEERCSECGTIESHANNMEFKRFWKKNRNRYFELSRISIELAINTACEEAWEQASNKKASEI